MAIVAAITVESATGKSAEADTFLFCEQQFY